MHSGDTTHILDDGFTLLYYSTGGEITTKTTIKSL